MRMGAESAFGWVESAAVAALLGVIVWVLLFAW